MKLVVHNCDIKIKRPNLSREVDTEGIWNESPRATGSLKKLRTVKNSKSYRGGKMEIKKRKLTVGELLQAVLKLNGDEKGRTIRGSTLVSSSELR